MTIVLPLARKCTARISAWISVTDKMASHLIYYRRFIYLYIKRMQQDASKKSEEKSIYVYLNATKNIDKWGSGSQRGLRRSRGKKGNAE